MWINNAGFGLLGSLEKTPPEKVRNFSTFSCMFRFSVRSGLYAVFATAHWPPALPCLVQVSSLACELPIPWMPYYNTAKAGLSGFAGSLLLDGNLPCRVIDFRPGDFNTPFVAKPGMATDDPALRAYREILDRHHARPLHLPTVAAASLARALRKKRSGIVRTGPFFSMGDCSAGSALLPPETSPCRDSPVLRPMKIAYLFTTFPKYSETFLAREVEALAQTARTGAHASSLSLAAGARPLRAWSAPPSSPDRLDPGRRDRPLPLPSPSSARLALDGSASPQPAALIDESG